MSELVRQHRSHLYGVMLACGLSNKEIGPILHHMEKVERHRGITDVINTFKGRMRCLIKNSGPYHLDAGGLWRGVFKPIHRISRRGRKGFRRALRIFRTYFIFIAPEPTKADYKKVRDTLAVEESDFTTLPEHIPLVPADLELGQVAPFHEEQYPLSNASVPFTKASVKALSVSPSMHLMTLSYFPSLVAKHYGIFRKYVGESLPPKSYFEVTAKDHSDRGKFDIVGSAVLLTKDGGYKQRLVANVFPILQLALSRLHRTLYDGLRRLPQCHVYDQKGGVAWATEMLRRGKRLTSIDLESASDNIPLKPQLLFLAKTYPLLEEDFSLFHDAARTSFRTPKGVYIKWHRGHPMGLKGSFPLFTLFLHSLIREFTEEFAIVGDDLIINAEAGTAVISTLKLFNIPISHSKSIMNATLGEFCGCFIDREGSLEVYKGRTSQLAKDPLGLYRQYGKRAFRFIYRDTKQARVKDIYNFKILNDVLGDEASKADFAKRLPISQLSKLRLLPAPPKAGGIPVNIVNSLIYDKTGLSPLVMESLPEDKQIEVLSLRRLAEINPPRFEQLFEAYLIKSWKFYHNWPSALEMYEEQLGDHLRLLSTFAGATRDLQALSKSLGLKEVPDLDALSTLRTNNNLRKLKISQEVENKRSLTFYRTRVKLLKFLTTPVKDREDAIREFRREAFWKAQRL